MIQWLLICVLVLVTAPAWAVTRYVEPTVGATGCSSPSDTDYNPATRTCGAGSSTVYVHADTGIDTGILASSGGDILYLRAGTYGTQDINMQGKDGSAGNYITVAGYPGETVTIAPTGGGRAIFTGSGPSYFYFQHMVWDGVNHTDGQNGNIIGATASNIVFDDIEIKNWHYNGLYFEAANVTIKNSHIHDQSSPTCESPTRWYGIYYHHGNNGLIEGNRIYNNPGGGIQVFPGPITGGTIRRNDIHDNNSCPLSFVGGIIVSEGTGTPISGVDIYDNYIYRNGVPGGEGNGIRVGTSGSNGPTDTRIFNNVIYNNQAVSGGWAYGVNIQTAASTGTLVQNNILVGNEAGAVVNLGTNSTISYNACAAGESCGTTGKLTIATVDVCTVSTSDFTLKAGSPCIGAGTSVATRTTGNSTQDIGAHEAIIFASCVVEDGDINTVRITFTNNVAPPLLPATGITTFTSRLATVANVVTAAVRTGDNRVDLTVTTPVTFALAVDISWASGNLTDSALIGGTLNQGYKTVLTNQACTNNVGAAASHVFTQAAFEFHGLRGTEAAPVGTPYATAPENTNILVRVGGSVRLRIALTCTTADCPPTGFYPRYSKNAGGYSNVVPDTYGADNIAFCGTSPDPDIPTNGTATTDQLSTAGAFVAGALVRTSNAIPTVDLDDSPAQKTELEYCFSFDTDATATDTYDIRLYQQDGTALNAYTVTPRMTLAAPSAGMGF